MFNFASTRFNEDFIEPSWDGHNDEIQCMGPEEILMLEQEYEDAEDALDHMRSAGLSVI